VSPPVVLLHGFTGSSAAWGDLPARGHDVTGRSWVPIDLPGHGGPGGVADASADSPDLLGSVTRRVADAAQGVFDLVGYSMGGRLALHVADRLSGRVRRMVLESASPGLASARDRALRSRADETWARTLEEDGLAAFVEAWERQPVLRASSRRSTEVTERIRKVRLGHRAEHLAAALRGLGTGALPSLWHRLSALPQPTLLLAGAEDRKFVDIAERMHALLPRARVEVVPEAGHAVHLDRPDAWLAAVARHLEGPLPNRKT